MSLDIGGLGWRLETNMYGVLGIGNGTDSQVGKETFFAKAKLVRIHDLYIHVGFLLILLQDGLCFSLGPMTEQGTQ